MDMDPSNVKYLKEFVVNVEEDFTILHHPDLEFFRDFLHRLGAKIPAPTATTPFTPEVPKDSSVVHEQRTVAVNTNRRGRKPAKKNSKVVRETDTSTSIGLPDNQQSDPSQINRAADFLVGWQTHGYKRPEDLTSDQVKAEAKHGWLTDEQYLAILFNAEYYGDLITDPPFEEEPSKQWLGRIFLCDRTLKLPEWPQSKNLMVEVKDAVFMFCEVSFTEALERRFYVTASRNYFGLYHYHSNRNLEQIDRAATKTTIDRIKAGLDDVLGAASSKK